MTETDSDQVALLEGVTVLELSTRGSGAYCGHLLALMGADVQRVDFPLAMDCPEDLAADLEWSINGLKTTVPDRSAHLEESMRRADLVIVDSAHDDAFDGLWTARTHELLELIAGSRPVVDLSVLRCADGAQAATAFVASALGGMSWGIGHRGREPLALPFDLPDYFAGAEGAAAACLALLVSESGDADPQNWDVSTTDVMATFVGQISSNFLPYERPWCRDGARATMSGGFYPAAMFPTSDGHITLVSRTDREWAAMRAAMGDPEWSRQPEVQDARLAARFHADRLDHHLSAWTQQHTSAEVARIGAELKFPSALILRPAEVLELDQFEHHGFLRPDRSGRRSVPGAPWRVTEIDAESPVSSGAEGPRPKRDRPLEGLKVLDLSWVWSGPMTTAALADLGADVIKVEWRDRADPSRLRGPAIRGGAAVEAPDLEASPYFTQMNRGKRSVAINMADPAGADLIRRLADRADVVVENMRPGALDRKGLGYADLAARNPGLVMLSMSMMGQTGPMSGIGGYAPVMSGLAGLDSLIGYDADDLIGTFNPALGDPSGADHSLAVLFGALVRRQRTGRGAWLDVSQIECLVSTMRVPLAVAARGRQVPVPVNGHCRFDPHGTFRALGDDEWVAVVARTDDERKRLAAIVGRGSDLTERLAQWIGEQDAERAAAQLRRAGIPAGRVARCEDLTASAWAAARSLLETYVHPYLGPVDLFPISWKLGDASFSARTVSPELGQHTASVLMQELGLDEAEINALRDAAVVETGQAARPGLRR